MQKIEIEEAITKVSGNYRYQKLMILIFGTGQIGLSFFIMGMPYVFPIVVCDDGGDCTIPENYSLTGTKEFKLYGSEEYKIGLIETSYFLGMIAGSIPLNWVSDKYGRRTLIKYSSITAVIAMFLAAFSWNIGVFIFASVIMGALELGLYVPTFVMFTEIVEMKNRNWYSGIYFSVWSFASILVSIIYMLGASWRLVYFICSFLFLIEFVLLRFIVESPRFLYTKHRYQEAVLALDKISTINRAGTFDYELQEPEITGQEKRRNILSFFTDKSLFFRFSICAICWFSVILGYYGMLFIMPTLTSSLYVEGVVMSSTELVANLVIAYSINILGRRKCSLYSFSTSGASFFGIFLFQTFLAKYSDYGVFVLSGLARFSLGAEFFVIFIYTAELFPTSVRSLAYGLCNITGRIAGLLSSNLFEICLALGINASLVISVFLTLSAVLSTLLVETLGKKMDEVDSAPVQLEPESSEKPRYSGEIIEKT